MNIHSVNLITYVLDHKSKWQSARFLSCFRNESIYEQTADNLFAESFPKRLTGPSA